MADAHSTSSAEVDSYVTPPVSVQSIHFAQVSDPAHPHTLGNEKSSKWSTQDDLLLCDALITQKKLGRSRDKAVFTIEAWNAVAEALKGSELVTGGAQKTVAQCKARWQRLKIEYRIIKHLRKQPGFQWDENTQMVTALAATWDNYVAEHRDAQPWRKKPFPAYGRVAHIIEDENGYDPGEENFKRRWNAAAQSAQNTQENKEPSTPAKENPSSSTSVFSVNGPTKAPVPIMPFATQVVPGVSMAMPLNGSASAIHQYRLSTPEANGKRGQSPVEDNQSANSKRSKSMASSTTAVASPSQQQFDFYPAATTTTAPAIIPQLQTYPHAPVTYAVQPMSVPTSTPVTTPASTSRLASAIQLVEASEGLSDADFVRVVQLFQRRAEAADAYLAIQSKRARSMYLRAELEDIARS